nr:hypothetical protein [Myxococcota bacterium]
AIPVRARWLFTSLPTALGELEAHAIEAQLGIVIAGRVDALRLGGGAAVLGGWMRAAGRAGAASVVAAQREHGTLSVALFAEIRVEVSEALSVFAELGPEIAIVAPRFTVDGRTVLGRDLALTAHVGAALRFELGGGEP